MFDANEIIYVNNHNLGKKNNNNNQERGINKQLYAEA